MRGPKEELGEGRLQGLLILTVSPRENWTKRRAGGGQVAGAFGLNMVRYV